jgi:hypothetical protein
VSDEPTDRGSPPVSRRRALLEMAIAAVLGLVVVIGPELFREPRPGRHHDLSSLFRESIERMDISAVIGLFVVGLALGFATRTRVVVVGAAVMAAFPLLSLADAIANGGHSLLGIEWLIDAILALISVAGAGVSRWLRRRFRN